MARRADPPKSREPGTAKPVSPASAPKAAARARLSPPAVEEIAQAESALERAARLGHNLLDRTPAQPASPPPAAPPPPAEKPSLQPKRVPLPDSGPAALAAGIPRQLAAWSHLSPRRDAVDRATMDEVRGEQTTRRRSLRKPANLGRFTSVGFEWDIATLKGAEDKPNPLLGISHLELAESSHAVHGLHFLLETDAGRVLEFITPPFLVRTRAKGDSLPLLADLEEIIAAMRQEVAGLVNEDQSLSGLIRSDWKAFGIVRWRPKPMADNLDWRNWSTSAKSGEKMRTGEEVKEMLRQPRALDSIVVGEVLSEPPQINIAVAPEQFAEAKVGSEGRRPDLVQDFLGLGKNLANYLFNPSPLAKVRLAGNASARLSLLLDQLKDVLVQQLAVPSIAALAELQDQGFKGEKVNEVHFEAHANRGSFVKDIFAVWLKTDLFTFAYSVLEPGDWLPLTQVVDHLMTRMVKERGQILPKGKEGDAVFGGMKKLLEGLKTQAGIVAKKHRENEEGGAKAADLAKWREDSRKGMDALFLGELKKIAEARPKLFEQSAKILGVRQDTFISPVVMLEWARKLGFAKILHVMEVRNTSQFMARLAKAEKAALVPLPAAPAKAGAPAAGGPPPAVPAGAAAASAGAAPEKKDYKAGLAPAARALGAVEKDDKAGLLPGGGRGVTPVLDAAASRALGGLVADVTGLSKDDKADQPFAGRPAPAAAAKVPLAQAEKGSEAAKGGGAAVAKVAGPAAAAGAHAGRPEPTPAPLPATVLPSEFGPPAVGDPDEGYDSESEAP
jgi:hypothetical protein